MSASRLATYRRWLGWSGTVICLILVAALIDALQEKANTEFNHLGVLAGEPKTINGHLPGASRDISEIQVDSSSPQLRLTIASTYKGFWMGGQMWKGQVVADPGCVPGRYRIAVRAREQAKADPALVFPIDVYGSERERNQRSASFFRRYLSAPAFQVAGALFPAVVIVFGGVYLLSNQMERHMREQGQAEIYMLKKTVEGLQVSFSMGSRQGLAVGTHLVVLDDSGLVIGQARVVQCSETEAVALVESGQQTEVGHIVSISNPQQTHSKSKPTYHA